MTKPKVSFFVMGYKGYSVLAGILAKFGAGQIGMVIIGQDNKVQDDYSQQLIELCQDYDCCWRYRSKAGRPTSRYAFAVAWQWLIHDQDNLIVFHDSLLPRYRGFSPLANCLINGEKQIGVTALWAADNYDCGEIIAQTRLAVHYPIKIKDAIKQISRLYLKLSLSIFSSIVTGKKLRSRVQNNKLASYSLWRDEQDYRIDWNQDATFIKRFIDAVGFPYRGASTTINNALIRILDAVQVDDVEIVNRNVGKVIFMVDQRPVVVCKQGLLKITQAIYDDTRLSIFPLTKFRVRLS